MLLVKWEDGNGLKWFLLLLLPGSHFLVLFSLKVKWFNSMKVLFFFFAFQWIREFIDPPYYVKWMIMVMMMMIPKELGITSIDSTIPFSLQCPDDLFPDSASNQFSKLKALQMFASLTPQRSLIKFDSPKLDSLIKNSWVDLKKWVCRVQRTTWGSGRKSRCATHVIMVREGSITIKVSPPRNSIDDLIK